ncbi:hypothetical protein CBI35_04825 [Pantoea sp. AV62]|nr:hypothetical protein HA39_06440 [Pantoea brenneri]OXM25837.1 hypothetical protein CBI35_04825 [Pantoea sp. AV62]HAI06461.1 hypothetical protein [Pantoea sp.]
MGFSDASDPEGVSQKRACFTPGAGAEKIHPIVPGRVCFMQGAGAEKIQPIVPGTRVLHAGCRGREDSPDRKDAFVIPDARPTPSLAWDALLFG